MINIESIDHLVLTVKDVSITCEFYSRLLGMKVITFSEGRKALSFGRQKINIHQIGQEFEPKANLPTPGSADICFLKSTPLPDFIDHLTRNGIEMLEGPVERTGAVGNIQSIYFRDPDGNLIEISS